MADNNQDNAAQQKGKLPLPTFSGEGPSASSISIDAELFLNRFNDWADVCGYQADRKVKTLSYALVGAGANWHKQMERRGKLPADDWPAVEREFRNRFVKAVSPRYIAGELNKLSQKPTESVADFLDRCQLAQTLLDEQWVVPAAAVNRAARLEVVETVHQVLVLHHFLRHLRPEIADNLALCQNLTTLDEHVKAAERIEKAGTEKATPKGNNVSAINEEVAAIGGGLRKKKKTPPSFYVCKICNTKGHYINDCPRSDRQTRRRGQGQQQQSLPQSQSQQQPQHAQQQQPPRHLGAIPKSNLANHWRPQQQPAAALSAGAFAYQPQLLQQQQPHPGWSNPMPPPPPQTIYPQLPPDDFPENVSTMSVHGDGGAASPGWPALRPGFQ